MYFTREPIIETIISPREGYKLVLRSSKHEKREEFCVDSVEVVNFGNHCFYRSLDRSVTFLLPVFDYEVVETRSQRLAIKTAGIIPSQEKEIKIGKGKEESYSEEKKKEKRSSRKRKEKGNREVREETVSHIMEEEEDEGELPMLEEVPKIAKPKVESMPRVMIPPPTTLIADSIARYTQVPQKEGRVEAESPEGEELDIMVSDEEESDLPF